MAGGAHFHLLSLLSHSASTHLSLIVSFLTHHPFFLPPPVSVAPSPSPPTRTHTQQREEDSDKQSIDWTELKQTVLVRVSERQRRGHSSIRATCP